MNCDSEQQHRRKSFGLFVACAVVWFLLDRVTKIHVDTSYEPGEVFARNILGLFQFDVVHNTGAAWGTFAHATGLLAGVSLIICAVVIGVAWVFSIKANLLEMIGFSLIVAGGIGNCVDRFAYGYVVDFITPTFVNFPTFNVADIGVTCGIVMVVLGYAIRLFAHKAQN